MEIRSVEGEALFPTTVWQVRFAGAEEVNRRVLEEMDAVDWDASHARRGLSELVEKRYGEDIFITANQVPAALEVMGAFGYCCLQIASEFGWDVEGHEFRITSMWAHVTPPGKNTQLHHHYPSDLSCAYYVRVPENAGALRFIDDRKYRALEPDSLTGHLSCRRNVDVEPDEGLMVVFPSWVSHQVGENRSAERRVSLSMNAKLVALAEAPPSGTRVLPDGSLEVIG